jgi:hypothetical protein
MTMSETLTASLARLPVTFRDIEAAAGVLARSVKQTRASIPAARCPISLAQMFG